MVAASEATDDERSGSETTAAAELHSEADSEIQ